jgi:hypothetical protein
MSVVATKKIVKTPTKSYQVRLTITPELHNDILKARQHYKYLDDVEIIKIFIGRGSKIETDNNYWSKLALQTFDRDEDDQPEDWSKTYKKTNSVKLEWK